MFVNTVIKSGLTRLPPASTQAARNASRNCSNTAPSPVTWRASNSDVRTVMSPRASRRQSSIERVACPTFSPKSHRI